MTNRQKKFCDEYLICGNATEAAKKAGYSAKSAKSCGQRMLTFANCQKYLNERMEQLQSQKIASAEEVLQHLTSVLRGESQSEVVIVEGTGDGCSEARKIMKAPDEKEKLKAAELLAKRYGILTEKVDVGGSVPVVICGEEALKD